MKQQYALYVLVCSHYGIGYLYQTSVLYLNMGWNKTIYTKEH